MDRMEKRMDNMEKRMEILEANQNEIREALHVFRSETTIRLNRLERRYRLIEEDLDRTIARVDRLGEAQKVSRHKSSGIIKSSYILV
ncbi:hypothetical protein BSNK01_30800 [Bacillaceae bacterium]